MPSPERGGQPSGSLRGGLVHVRASEWKHTAETPHLGNCIHPHSCCFFWLSVAPWWLAQQVFVEYMNGWKLRYPVQFMVSQRLSLNLQLGPVLENKSCWIGLSGSLGSGAALMGWLLSFQWVSCCFSSLGGVAGRIQGFKWMWNIREKLQGRFIDNAMNLNFPKVHLKPTSFSAKMIQI